MEESSVSKLIQLALGSIRGLTLFRNNVGMGWTGKMTKVGDKVVLENARPLHAGLFKGSSDLIGWKTVVVTPAMLGKKVAIFTAIEVKRNKKGTASPEQVHFIETVRESGGIAGVAFDDESAKSIVANGVL